MRRLGMLMVGMLVLLVAGQATAQDIRVRKVMGTDLQMREIAFDANGYPIVQCVSPAAGNDVNVQDGAGTDIDSRSGALAVVQEDGSGALVNVATAANQLPDGHNVTVDNASLAVTGAFWQATQPVSAAALPLPAGAAENATLAGIATAQSDGSQLAKVNTRDGAGNPIDSQTSALSVALEDGLGALLSITATVLNANARLEDGAGNDIDSRTGALAVALEDGSGSALGITGTALDVNTATGTVIDSADAGQDDSWIDVTAPLGVPPQDSDKGVILKAKFIPAGPALPVKLYELPAGKEFHEVAVTATDSDGNAFEHQIQVFAVNDIPSAAWTLADWMSVGALVVPAYKCSRDGTKTTVAQPLIRTKAEYLLIVVYAVTTAPATNPRVRVYSYNAGDSQ